MFFSISLAAERLEPNLLPPVAIIYDCMILISTNFIVGFIIFLFLLSLHENVKNNWILEIKGHNLQILWYNG